MWEDLGFSAPTNVIIPSGAGSNILGCDIGFSEVSSRHVASHQLAQGHALGPKDSHIASQTQRRGYNDSCFPEVADLI